MKITAIPVFKSIFTFGLILLFMTPIVSLAADLAGHVDAIKGTAWAQSPGEAPRKLEKGSPFYVGDRVYTESRSSVKLLFEDDTKFFIGAESEMNIDTFVYRNTEQPNSFSSRILKGTFRFVTGLIAHEEPESMEVETAVATIGVRGTNVVGEADLTSATIILMEPEDDISRRSAIVVFNEYGSVDIDEPGYGTEIPDQFSPPSPPRRMRLQTINNIMRSMQSIQRINVPRPRIR